LPVSVSRVRALNFARVRGVRRRLTAVGALALLLIWHAVYAEERCVCGSRKRVEDRQLRKEIDDLNPENAQPAATAWSGSSPIRTPIGQVAQGPVAHVKPNEVIVTRRRNLPDESANVQGAGK